MLCVFTHQNINIYAVNTNRLPHTFKIVTHFLAVELTRVWCKLITPY